MKFMGSKKWMLGNGLGELLDGSTSNYGRFVDLFCGSGAVSTFVARRHKIPVHACDLQGFSTALAGAVVERTVSIDWLVLYRTWVQAATAHTATALDVPSSSRVTKRFSVNARLWCASSSGLISRAYGGHYFSPIQAMWFDALLSTLPSDENLRTVAIAALITAASRCAASPGHTAQPFQPTRTARQFLEEAWNRDVLKYVELGLQEYCGQFALRKGTTAVCDALEAAKGTSEDDLVFLDPPYSGVHYSRFYHVLETMFRGKCGDVSGVGRYPEPSLRPKSDFSMRSTSLAAMETLLTTLADRKASVILTFPNHECSNGLSGKLIRRIASLKFLLEQKVVSSRFSTLGGPAKSAGATRHARRSAQELILFLRPKRVVARGRRMRQAPLALP